MDSAIHHAISAHVSWLARFQNALLGIDREPFDPQQIGDPTLCEFGRWLLGHPDFTTDSEQAERVRTLHQSFHEKAAVIAKLLGSYAPRHAIDAQWQQLTELSAQLVEILYQIREQQHR